MVRVLWNRVSQGLVGRGVWRHRNKLEGDAQGAGKEEVYEDSLKRILRS